jgi:DNA-binding transcriptional regulator YiaG
MSWQNKRTMSPREIKQALEEFGISQAALGRYLGRGERTVHRWMDGSYLMSPAEVLLIRALLEHGMLPVVPPKPKVAR